MMEMYKNCGRYVRRAKRVKSDFSRASYYFRAAECYKDKRKLKKAIEYYQLSAIQALGSKEKSTPRRRRNAINSFLWAAKLSCEIGEYNRCKQLIMKVGQLLGKLSLSDPSRTLISNLMERYKVTDEKELEQFRKLKVYQLAPPFIVGCRSAPRRVRESVVFDVTIRMISDKMGIRNIELAEKIPKELEIVGGMTKWKGSLVRGEKLELSYRLKAKKFGTFTIGPAILSTQRKTIHMCDESKLTVIPSTIRVVKQLLPSKTIIGNKVQVRIIIQNQSSQDIHNVKIEDVVPEQSDFLSSDTSVLEWKKLKKGSTRVLRYELVPRTVIGNIKLGKAKMTFEDTRKNKYTIRSNGVELEVVEKTVGHVKCVKCGTTMPRNAKFCGKCGAKLKTRQ